MLEILKSEFFWGIVIGLLLSFFGGWALAYFTTWMTQRMHTKRIRLFCTDTLRNISNIILRMDESRDRTRAIYHDFLALIDVEIGIYGRNREHLILLPADDRDDVRNMMNSIAIKRAQVTQYLDQFYKEVEQANQLQVAGNGPQSQRVATNANAVLADAHQAVDRLVAFAKDAAELTKRLEKK